VKYSDLQAFDQDHQFHLNTASFVDEMKNKTDAQADWHHHFEVLTNLRIINKFETEFYLDTLMQNQ